MQFFFSCPCSSLCLGFLGVRQMWDGHTVFIFLMSVGSCLQRQNLKRAKNRETAKVMRMKRWSVIGHRVKSGKRANLLQFLPQPSDYFTAVLAWGALRQMLLEVRAYKRTIRKHALNNLYMHF